jgi:hypothetical protein
MSYFRRQRRPYDYGACGDDGRACAEGGWLHRARRHWVVWVEDRDWTNDPEYKWQVAAYLERKGASAEAAAAHLILARWELEMEDRQLGHFHFVSNEGL